jgi:hypothetical protein
MQCGGTANLAPLHSTAWRVVEAQHRVATRQLVDSDDEQHLLEQLIETAKPPRPRDPEFKNLHWLYYTPFRYPPLPFGSRFASRSERSLFYASQNLPTALAEKAYYKFLFLQGTQASLSTIHTEHTAFRAHIATPLGVNLCSSAFHRFIDDLASPTNYQLTQQLGQDMRAANVHAFLYRSARDPNQGHNLGVFSPKAFLNPTRQPKAQTWGAVTTPEEVIFYRKPPTSAAQRFSFPRQTFLINGQLPHPSP